MHSSSACTHTQYIEKASSVCPTSFLPSLLISSSSMATSSLQQENDGALDLSLSLGGPFSRPKSPCDHVNCSSEEKHASPPLFVDRMKNTQPQRHHDSVKKRRGLHSQDIKQQKTAREDQDHASPCISSVTIQGNLSKAHSRSFGNPEYSPLPADRHVKGHDVHSMPSSGVHRVLSDSKKAMRVAEVLHGFEIRYESALQQLNPPETPILFIPCSHSATVPCTSCIETGQGSLMNMQSSGSAAWRESCPLSSRNSATSLPLSGVDHVLPAKRKPSSAGLDEEGKICQSSSTELENGDYLDEESTSRTKVTEPEAPRSRCGSNSDMIGSMGPSAAPITTSVMYMHPSILPAQGPFHLPMPWGFTLPYAAHYPSYLMPPPTISFPWVSPVPDSASGLQSSEAPPSSCNEGKNQENQETSSEADALTGGLTRSTPLLLASEKMQAALPLTKPPPAIACETSCRSVSDSCTSALSSRPVSSTSPTANSSSDVCMSSWQPLTSSTSPTTQHSSAALKQAKPGFFKEDSSLTASNSLPSQEGCSKSPCIQKADDAGGVGSNSCAQSKHNTLPGRKSTKTVRFSSDERYLVKPTSGEDRRHEPSSDSPLLQNLQSLGEKPLGSGTRHNRGILKRTAQVCVAQSESDASANSGSSSESLDLDESLHSDIEQAGNLELVNVARLPKVSTTCAGPNGKTIYGVMYITKTKQACLICSCHGTHMSPSEFVQHSGSTDLTNPERSIVVSGFSCVKQVA